VHDISKLIEQFRHQLLSVDCATQGKVQLMQPISIKSTESLLHWLNGQSIFPAFYWCNRDKSEEVVACGAVKIFSDIRDANNFVQCSPKSEMRVWGLNAFDQLSPPKPDQNKGFLFLPRIEIYRRKDGDMICLNLYGESSLADDISEAIALLATLRPAQDNSVQDVNVISAVDQPGKKQWCELLGKALLSIQRRDFDKVVLARKTTLKLAEALNPVQFIDSSKRVNHDCFHFMMRFNHEQAFLGSSPERLFYRSGFQLQTEALAGTVASSTDEAEATRLARWLMDDDKNQRENQLVVDDICQRLADHVKKVEVQPVEIVKLRKVQHLRRGIRAELNYINDVDCLYWLQPTAAVAGLPRQAALDFILKYEPFDREWYAGSAGYISYKKSEFSVALRSAFIERDNICLYAGAGIVAGSDPLYEWLEIENKAAGLRTLLKEDEFISD
jgi:menaquinone-specific isochorismate synthase